MKRILSLLLAFVLLLTACGVPAAQPTAEVTATAQRTAAPDASPTPTATAEPTLTAEISPHLPPSGYPWPEFAAGPAEGGYTFSCEALGFSFTVPAEVSHKVAVSPGVEYWDPDGPSFTVYFVPENGRYPIDVLLLCCRIAAQRFFLA